MPRYFPPPVTEYDRKRAEQLAREAGRRGEARVPYEALMPGGRDLSDTATFRVVEAFLDGQLQRCKP